MLEVRKGRLRIPVFQRGLRWNRQEACKLIDSIYRGYPVGTLLFWETKAQAEVMRFGSLVFDTGPRSDALLVVDGQQRLVSLARMLLSAEFQADEFEVHFDLEERKFTFPLSLPRQEEDPSRWLPLQRILDSEHLFEWLFARNPSRERRVRAIQLGKRIREYDIPAYIVRTDDESILREIFGRLNTTGKQLAASEVFDALNGSRSGHRPATLSEMANSLQSLGFGRVDDKLLYSLLRVVHGVDVIESGKDEPLRLDPDKAAEVYAQTEQIAGHVIRFICHDAGIPHYSLLPYKQPLVTLGKFFHHHPEPRPRSRELLARWLWRGALNGSHQGNTVSTRRALNLIDPDDEEGSVQRMLEMVGKMQPELPGMTERFNFRYAIAKLQSLALMELQPRHLESGQRLDMTSFLDYRQADQDPPFTQLLDADSAIPLTLSVANRLVHPANPGGLRRLLVQVSDKTVLASHGISSDAIAALRINDLQRFLVLRAQELNRHFARFFARHARWDEPDRPSLAALLVADDDPGGD